MRILHLMHSTAVGGVESAVARLRTDLAAREHAADHSARASGDSSTPVEYRVGVLADAEDGRRALEADAIGGGMNSPLAALRLLRTMRRHRPDVLVTSLWRAVALGLLGRRRTTAWMVWVHNTRYTHALDALVHRLALPRADVVLCDSHAAAEEIVRPTLTGHATAPPVLLVRPEAAPLPVTAPAQPRPTEPLRLLSWGRLAPQKRLGDVLELLAALQTERPGGAQLTLIGTDDGEGPRLREHAERLGLRDALEITGPGDRARIARAIGTSHTFVQLSSHEGFAMSAHEALHTGMVCVLTPVGDLRYDTVDGTHALHHHGIIRSTARRLLALEADPAAWRAMSAAARDIRTPPMTDAFLEACHRAAPTAAATGPTGPHQGVHA